MSTHATRCLERGRDFPFDRDDEDRSEPAADWAHEAARGILADLTDRRGIRQELDQWDTGLRLELVAEFAQIIRETSGTGSVDWASAAAQAMYDNLADRKGVGDEMADIDDDVQEELRGALAAILTEARPKT